MMTVDARGLSCPQPALMTRNAVRAAEDSTIEVLVDTETARDNCTRVARREGWNVEVTAEGGGYRLVLSK
jgi:tRNA 2-thiouridine synthesizing protein A